jgi:hypothetical protein
MPVPDFSPGEVLTAAAMDSIGLWLVGSGSLSLTTSATNVTGVFSSTYKNYRVLLNITARSTTGRIDMKYIVGTTATSANYFQSGIGSDYASNATVYYQRSNNDDRFFGLSTASQTSLSFDVFNANATLATLHNGTVMDRNLGFPYSFGGVQTASTAFTGFQLFTSTGTATVEYQVFGYRN